MRSSPRMSPPDRHPDWGRLAAPVPEALRPDTGQAPAGPAGLLLAGAALLLSLLAAGIRADPAGDREAVYGIWASRGTMIEVGPGSDGSLSARIIALKHPLWREKDGVGRVGEAKTDLHNPDKTLRRRPLLGMELLSGYEYRKGRWHGRLYLPTRGSTMDSSVRVRDGRLRLRGYMGISLLGKTQTFDPIAECNENILTMIRVAGLENTPCDAAASPVADARE